MRARVLLAIERFKETRDRTRGIGVNADNEIPQSAKPESRRMRTIMEETVIPALDSVLEELQLIDGDNAYVLARINEMGDRLVRAYEQANAMSVDRCFTDKDKDKLRRIYETLKRPG